MIVVVLDHLPVMKQYNLVPVSQQVVEEVWFTIHNAGRKPTAGSRPVKQR